MKTCVILTTIFLCTGVFAEGNAVSGPNGKIGAFGGDMNGDDGYNVEGSFSFPIGSKLGMQLDALYTDVSDSDLYGAGGHLFWRDPNLGLLGVNVGALRENDLVDTWSGGLEVEYYLGLFTLGLHGGAANIDYDIGSLPFIETDETGYYGTGSLAAYPWDNLLLSASYTRALDNGLGRGQIEYQSPFSGLSIFGDFAMGDHDYNHAMLGVRYYLGKEKTLIQRHREDDPASVMHEMLYTIGIYGAEFNQNADDYIASNPSGGSIFGSGQRSGGNFFGTVWTSGVTPSDRDAIPE